MAWQSVEDEKCPGCGNPLSETTVFENRTGWVAEKVTCHACHAKSSQEQDGPGEYVIATARSDHVG